MQIATWNVNSIKVRLEHVLKWMADSKTDALVMQETKTVDELFPKAAFEDAGYSVIYCGQKTYNGVALVTRKDTITSVTDPVYNIPGYPDEQKRFIAATITHTSGRTVRLAGGYFPNGQEVGCDKYLYKLDWIATLTRWVKEELTKGAPLVLGGDFNIAPTDEDVWDPESWKDKILVSTAERASYRRLIEAGLVDTWMLGLHAPETYSWWDYRMSGFEKNHGLRIDHLLAADSVAKDISEVWIDTVPRSWEKPSDHAPVVMKIA